mgnify:CR=1 FL=1|jgi:hypothetical protein
MSDHFAYIEAVAVATPGIPDWDAAKTQLQHHGEIDTSDKTIPKAACLSSREKRRASDTVNLSLHLAQTSCDLSDIDPKDCRSVFLSSDGDADIFHELASNLAESEPAISPTLFHQSLHNSASGYWHIATGSQMPSTALSIAEHTFSAGLLSSLIEVQATQIPSLVAAYDLPSPKPMDAKNPTKIWFGVSFILTPLKTAKSLAKLTVEICEDHPITVINSDALKTLAIQNTIARCLPLLDRLASSTSGDVILDYLSPSVLKLNVEIVQ